MEKRLKEKKKKKKRTTNNKKINIYKMNNNITKYKNTTNQTFF